MEQKPPPVPPELPPCPHTYRDRDGKCQACGEIVPQPLYRTTDEIRRYEG